MIESSYEISLMLRTLYEDHAIPFEHIVVGGGGALLCMELRESTEDLNLWLDEESFNKVAKYQNVIVHPMVDTAFQYKTDNLDRAPIWIRKRNHYFPIINVQGIQIFNPLTLMIQKRGGYARVERPLAKREQDIIDIRALNALMAEVNQVKAA